MRYIGSKSRVAAAILDLVGSPDPTSTFVDAFCGTGAVAAEAAERGWRVRLNDHLVAATCLAEAQAAPPTPSDFVGLGGYRDAIAHLESLPPTRGFIRAHYSPDSRERLGHERRYLTPDNAGRIDGIRGEIRTWREADWITPREERLLLADLLEATSQVANTAGTYGCYLREWSTPALRPLRLRPRSLHAETRSVVVHQGDVWDVPFAPSDVAYFDPPYTKRQYAAYYHLLETIAVGDRPVVTGITGLRPWRDRASDFCYKTRALGAITSLIEATAANRVFLSYSSEGHVPLASLEQALRPSGDVRVHQLGEIGRYRSNGAASANGSSVREYVLEVTRAQLHIRPESVGVPTTA